ncbi:Essential recombination function protein [uncultured Caudovirales phage]|uniref:Essential recombination function protein n=1 Tax=uncultured Caudovirales phage TaxID=2100421 RepID=A0A6J5KLA0_9CAUD|nr:Essential recombination function protein [uncultured Caudovirales phage]
MNLVKIQAELKAPKAQTNDYGKYKYRKIEDILEAVKPILFKYNTALVISDEVVQVGDRIYVKATATLLDNTDNHITVNGWAREDEVKKLMDAAQITGSASTYARKRALEGMFALDDTKDSDATNKHQDEVGEDKRMELILLLENTTYDEETKTKLAIKISNFTTQEQFDKATKAIMKNQIK